MAEQQKVIERYFKLDEPRWLDERRWEQIKKNLQPLIGIINRSGGEYNLQLRENYFNIYYQGNSLALVRPSGNGTYTAYIHEKFAQGDALKKLEKHSINKPSEEGRIGSQDSEYVIFRIRPSDFHRFFQSNNLNALASKVRRVGNGEEITFEQAVMTDNPPSANLIIIDRQVADHRNRAQIDLLALARDSVDRPFHFLVIEVKLGRNPELSAKVGRQLTGYVNHVRNYIKDYADCYRKNYRQKKELGLFGPDLSEYVEIDEDRNSVEGLVVVCGYSGLAKQAINNLRKEIGQNQWDIEVKQMPRFLIV